MHDERFTQVNVTKEHARYMAGDRVAVLLPLPLAGPYDYLVGAGAEYATGDIVDVPLGNRRATGVVWGAATGEVDASKLREIYGRRDVPPLPASLVKLTDWISRYTLYPQGAVLRMALSVPDALDPPKPETAYTLAADPPEFRSTKARDRVIAFLSENPPLPAADIAREAGCGASVVKGLADAGVLAAIKVQPDGDWPVPDPARDGVVLSEIQAAAANDLCDGVGKGFAVTLIDGVPGSGKTEVYFEAVARALADGRQVLVMLPEIALGAQWLARFRDRFGTEPAMWHSELTGARRRDTWRAVAEGKVRVVVGARSALFLPFHELGLIVVDEEHDGSFKQEDGVVYHARDMAVVRAQLEDIPAVLVSATPSLESVTNVRRGRYREVTLPSRHGGADLADVEVIDMRKDGPARGHWLSPMLAEALAETFEAGDQAMLFLNRRGYAPLTLCRTCGHRLQCPRCTAWLVEHRLVGRLQCHHCGFQTKPPEQCPNCEDTESMVPCGPGVERLAEEIQLLFPEARTVIAASDMVHGPKQAAELVRMIEEKEIDLIIGTQIVAKGYHFPGLTLVGVVDADLGLSGGEFRAAEKTFQLLYQVAGRAGRGDRPGRVFLQTYMPDHNVMKALTAGDRDAFIDAESAAREAAHMPPFGRLVALIVSGRDEAAVDGAAAGLARTAPRNDGIRVLGPAPAPLALLRGRHRRRLLLSAPRAVNPQGVVRDWIARAPIAKKVRVQVDVDPVSFF
ncbi:MAG: primosomal protein N' [Rhodospirillales bacterium]|nr:primosomal protein N' [Rhodospirillales bacterium]MBO6788109.1 primosomal protein N' [Rhodospirillales bacterium]